MSEIMEYMRNRVHSNTEYHELIKTVTAMTEKAERLEANLEYVAMMADVELPDMEEGEDDV